MKSHHSRKSHPEHRLGSKRASVQLVEYFDFQCPYCAQAELPIRKVLEAFEGDVSLVVRHFPLFELHERAEEAALASEAASLQGKFWEMHDLLFESQEDLSLQTINDLTQFLQLNQHQFWIDFRNPVLAAYIRKDIADGERKGVRGTPTLFVNDLLLEGEVSFETLSRAVVGFLQEEPSKAA